MLEKMNFDSKNASPIILYMKKNPNLKSLFALTLFFCFFSISSSAQNAILIKYFDSTWSPTSKDAAFFFTEMVKVDTFYKCTSYWMKSKKLNCKSAYIDTLFTKPVDLLIRYYENGKIEDSTYFNQNGTFKNTYHYYNNGKLWVHYQNNLKTKKEITDAYDVNGNRIEDFIYSKEADFPDGSADWKNYLGENIKTKVPVDKGAPVGTYQVVVKFIVSKNGKISDIQPETNFGYGMEDEVIRVIKKSPKWNSAILMGKTVNAYRRQPITFVVSKE